MEKGGKGEENVPFQKPENMQEIKKLSKQKGKKKLQALI